MTSWHDLPFETKVLIFKAYIDLHIKDNAKPEIIFTIKFRRHKHRWWSAIQTFLLLVPALYSEAILIVKQLIVDYINVMETARRLLPEVEADWARWVTTNEYLVTAYASIRADDARWAVSTHYEYFKSLDDTHDKLILAKDLYRELLDEQFRANVEWCSTKQAQKLIDEICRTESARLLEEDDILPAAERRGTTHAPSNSLQNFVKERARRRRNPPVPPLNLTIGGINLRQLWKRFVKDPWKHCSTTSREKVGGALRHG